VVGETIALDGGILVGGVRAALPTTPDPTITRDPT
jgi:hypothetical protein